MTRINDMLKLTYTTLCFNNADISIGGNKLLKNISLELKKDMPTAILGANGSGKSTLLKSLVGDPDVSIENGNIMLKNKINSVLWSNLSIRDRAINGVFMAWQHPPPLLGLKQHVFLRTILNTQRASRGEATLDPFDFLDTIRPHLKRIGLTDDWLERSVGDGFSGGEKKKNELLQILLLEPEWVLCDELEAGMDLDTLHLTANLLTEHVNKDRGLLVVSHNPQFLDALPLKSSIRLGNGTVTEKVTGDNLSKSWRKTNSYGK